MRVPARFIEIGIGIAFQTAMPATRSDQPPKGIASVSGIALVPLFQRQTISGGFLSGSR